MTREVRKLVSGLKVGDEVKGYGVLSMYALTTRGNAMVASHGMGNGVWPADAEVTVLVKEKRWRITFETTDERVAECWRTVSPEKLATHADHITVEEVES